MPVVAPHPTSFNVVSQLYSRLTEDDEDEQVSVDDKIVPEWQRRAVWSEEQQGWLALSILQRYPIGLIILWKRPDGILVPIDGRQRITAIQCFRDGEVTTPDFEWVPDEYRAKSYDELTLRQKEAFSGYGLQIVQYDDLPEDQAMDIFVRLQRGTPLNKAEVRAALGGRIARLVTNLTTDRSGAPPHRFFELLTVNHQDRRKSHRGVCDSLLHEYLNPNTNKHWSQLEAMYRTLASSLPKAKADGFRGTLDKFTRELSMGRGADAQLIPPIRSVNFITTLYRAWRALQEYDLPAGFKFATEILEFEASRAANPREVPWVQFTAALSNAGYSEDRMRQRHDILMGFIFERHPSIKPKTRDAKRAFTLDQKIAIWYRADGQCQWTDHGERCDMTFDHPRNADADHIVRWVDGGATTVVNGRLLCAPHNRARGDRQPT